MGFLQYAKMFSHLKWVSSRLKNEDDRVENILILQGLNCFDLIAATYFRKIHSNVNGRVGSEKRKTKSYANGSFTRGCNL
ncbi:hypothetical protein QVD17_27880 [Tagetes erecta]|uniref:Uncharacterized protein n=1 Tax=Tagetes erecta TaxID=13708 RepID=A0AAD8K9D3_TARER|nr:hypothetical protein QVD17_27880 [Tagetes erecta]